MKEHQCFYPSLPPPFWPGQVWYTQEKGFVVRHENMGEVEVPAKDSNMVFRPGYDKPEPVDW